VPEKQIQICKKQRALLGLKFYAKRVNRAKIVIENLKKEEISGKGHFKK
jgi:hypothetical protein